MTTLRRMAFFLLPDLLSLPTNIVKKSSADKCLYTAILSIANSLCNRPVNHLILSITTNYILHQKGHQIAPKT